MGNKGSSEPTMVAYSPATTRDENPYETSLPARLIQPSTTSTPPVPPRGMERRAMTMISRDRHSDTPRLIPVMRRQSASDFSAFSSAVDAETDQLRSHVVENRPKDNEDDVPLGTTISVHFDRDVKSVNINKLFEVHCNSVDPSLNPVKGRLNYDARQQRAEFIPHNTLFPNSQYTVILLGRAITTTQCPHSANIKNAELHFHTCNPAPKRIGIKLKGHGDEPEMIQIANYYDLYNSLIVWSTRKWGCSGEHVMGMYTENEDGKLQPLKADQDVLNLRENEVVVVEIKD